MNIERNFLRVRRPSLITEAVNVFAIPTGAERVVFGGNGISVVLTVARGVFELQTEKEPSAHPPAPHSNEEKMHAKSYPEINLEVPATSKFPVANLKCHCHLVVLVQGLVKAFS